jgi:hypothetical protein
VLNLEKYVFQVLLHDWKIAIHKTGCIIHPKIKAVLLLNKNIFSYAIKQFYGKNTQYGTPQSLVRFCA